MADKIQCTICGEYYEQYTSHTHNPNGKPVPQKLPADLGDDL